MKNIAAQRREKKTIIMALILLIFEYNCKKKRSSKFLNVNTRVMGPGN